MDVRLWCCFEGDNRVFSVLVSPDRTIDDLKVEIYRKKEKTIFGCDAMHLDLSKVDEDLRDVEEKTFDRQQYHPNSSSRRLWSRELISNVWPGKPPNNRLHILVGVTSPILVHDGGRATTLHQRSGAARVPASFPYLEGACLRNETVSSLYKMLMRHSFVLVRGTPGSGKTTLTGLLARHIKQQDQAVNVILIPRWCREDVALAGGWESYLQRHRGWKQSQKTVFIFDKAQVSYDDLGLWLGLFKDTDKYPYRFAIAFASYGSPFSRFNVRDTPFIVGNNQRVTLRHKDCGDGLGTVGVLFSRVEFDELIHKQFCPPEFLFDLSFYDAVFDITGGHVGAICEFVNAIAAHDSYRRLKHTPSQSYTWDSYLDEVTPDYVFDTLFSGTIFSRGLPHDEVLQLSNIADIFFDVLRDGSKVKAESEFITGEDVALDRCFRNGWLHADEFIDTHGNQKIAFTFPSRLHHSFVGWKLCDFSPTTPPESDSVLDFVIRVIDGFHPMFLGGGRKIGPGCIQPPLEVQYQDEFYRSCHTRWKGSLKVYPEFGTKNGRVDFYVPSRRWGVELLHEGNHLAKHSGRFARSEAYGSDFDYILLDCRTTWPKQKHPEFPKLYHVVFSEEYHKVSILNNMLRSIHDRGLSNA